jgi:hypothetical protein
MATDVRKAAFPTPSQIKGEFPIDYIGHYDDYHFIYNGEKFGYPQNCIDPMMRANLLKEMRRYRDHFLPVKNMSKRDLQVRKKIIQDMAAPTPEERASSMIEAIRNLAKAILSILAYNFRARL